MASLTSCLFSALFIVLILNNGCDASRGAVTLDSLNFDKVLSKFGTSLVKFDTQYPYGPKEDAYTAVAKLLAGTPDLLVAQVGIQDFGEKENADLAARFNVKKEDWPAVFLFKDGSTASPIKFEGKEESDWSGEKLKTFVKKHTNIRLVLDKCIEALDVLAEKLIATTDKAIQANILEKAKAEQSKLTREDEKRSADIYVKVMQKIIDRGNIFVDSELTRVKNLLEGKLSDTKKNELQTRINILQSFVPQSSSPSPKTEL